jgi:Dyp-type peroxidase family
MPHPVIELDDIQGLVRSGYGALEEASFLLVEVVHAAEAKAWLASVAGAAGAAPLSYQATHAGDLGGAAHEERALQVAISAAGLRSLGASEALIRAFSRDFCVGMAGAEAQEEGRSRRLGDIDANNPLNWEWGGFKPPPHLVILLYAERGHLNAFRQMVAADLALGFHIQQTLDCSVQEDDEKDRREPFGFIDGLSQPEIDWEDRRETGVQATIGYRNLIAAGEFLLGYPNEYGLYTDRPMLDPAHDPADLLSPAADNPKLRDLGRNGCYLVFRQLEQDVGGFWRFVNAHSPDGEGTALAEAMLGRRLSTGEPLAGVSRQDIPGVGPKVYDIAQNNFTYEGDPDGLACPFGAHIRRANPRSGDIPGGRQGWLSLGLRMLGLKHGGPREDLVSSTRLHRLLRRGRAYGDALGRDDALRAEAGEYKRGIHFIALAANISRQFEFVQSAWIANAHFNGMSGETDPLLGARGMEGSANGAFSLPRPSGPSRKVPGLPQFVTVRGGAYFFLPSLRALRFFGGLPAPEADADEPARYR